MKSIAILGGTFDPIHNAHLELAHLLVNTLHFDTVLFIPCKQNLLKINPPATAQERIDMIKLAIAPFSSYQCDTRETDRDTPSYTIETLKSLRKSYPEDSLAFIIGVDAFNDLEQWHYFEDFLDYVHLIIFPRPGYTLTLKPPVQTLVDRAQTQNINDLHHKKQGCIYFSDEPKNPISSTEIRALLQSENKTHLLNYLPASVLSYITNKKVSVYTQSR